MTKCRVCNSRDKIFLFKKYGFDIVRCKKCDLIYSDFSPTQKFLKNYYSKNYFVGGKKKLGYDNYSKEEQSSRLTARKRISLLRIKPKGKILDIGCAYGYFLSEMSDNWDKYGLEISQFACNQAASINPNAHIKNKILTPDEFSGQKFDLITLWDVVEHLDKPIEVLSTIIKKLKKGGKLALSTGDVGSVFSHIQGSKWHLYTPPQHLSFFEPYTINKLLKSVGFRKISVSHPPAYYPVSYVIHKLSSVYGIKIPSIRIFDNLVLPINLGDIMVITATK
jgi:SAM-dependent methyltransferase